jgi:DNA-binding NtrC family response regulator
VPAAAEPWLVSAARSAQAASRLRAELIAGEAAWDRNDLARLEAAVGATAAAEELPGLAWRRHHLQALLAMAKGDGAGVVRHIRRAFASRRGIRPIEAASLWNDLAVGRSLAGDLAGAERALRHVVRLTDESEGDRRLTLTLCNLAEVRLRRGELKGVRDVLRRAAKANMLAGHWRGWAQDRELEARYELVRGRPGGAIACVEETLEKLSERGLDWRRGQLSVMAARAHGWLGDAAAARDFLAATTKADRAELELEERAPLLALAGDREGALAENPPGPCHDLWQQLLTGAEEADWTTLGELEPYRAARLVFDAELLTPGRAPRAWVRRAAAILRAVGAVTLAERLVSDDAGPWQALETYLAGGAPAVERLGRLLAVISPEARLTWRDEDREIELVAGVGGGQALERPVHGGAMRLVAPQIGAQERVAVALACRDVPATRLGSRRARRRSRHGMIGESAAMIAALDRLSRFAAQDLPVLIHGETGTGKEIAARLVHSDSRRAAGAFVPVNCAELGESLLLSELFGHVKGAFTGADRDRTGIFEAARGGTVLLDEIGDMPLLAQSKLLRVLQEGEVRRVGESIARPVDVRIVAATHRDLEAMVDEGGFRQDLFYRLGVGRVVLPPLRERGQDLLLLVEHFLAGHGAGVAPRLADAARAKLVAHSWPGNVRELSNVLTVAVALADGDTIEPEHLDLPATGRQPLGGYHERVEAFRRALVQEAVTAAGGNRAEAARRLGLSRQALSYLTRQLDIE